MGCALLLCGVAASCSDATAPSGTLVIVVSPDTVHLGQGLVPPFVSYTEHVLSIGQKKIWITMPELETEVAPGKWSPLVDPNNLYLQPALGDAVVAATSSDLSGVRSLYVPTVPGRYRLRQRFQLTALNATDATGPFSEATSNVFVLATP